MTRGGRTVHEPLTRRRNCSPAADSPISVSGRGKQTARSSVQPRGVKGANGREPVFPINGLIFSYVEIPETCSQLFTPFTRARLWPCHDHASEVSHEPCRPCHVPRWRGDPDTAQHRRSDEMAYSDGVMTDEILDRLRQQREGIRAWLEGRCRECLAGLYHDDSNAAGVCRSCRSRLVRAVGERSVT